MNIKSLRSTAVVLQKYFWTIPISWDNGLEIPLIESNNISLKNYATDD